MGIEFELKFSATPENQLAIAQETGDAWHTIQMETTYYDTPDGALSKRHYTLRRRLENGLSVCTVKTPAGDLGRGEWETQCDAIEDAIEPLCLLGAPKNLLLLTMNGIVPICGARFTRQCCTLVLEDCTVELALDTGVLLGGSREMPLCEVEVELKEGDRDAATYFAKELSERFGLKPQHKSKFRRALDLYKGE